jgi:hypothetical protein
MSARVGERGAPALHAPQLLANATQSELHVALPSADVDVTKQHVREPELLASRAREVEHVRGHRRGLGWQHLAPHLDSQRERECVCGGGGGGEHMVRG